jgi:hypothetical protein
MPAMFKRMMCMLPKAMLGVALMCSFFGCATAQGQPGDSIEWRTGSKKGNPFAIRLTVKGTELKAVLVNVSSSEQVALHDSHLQVSTLELVPSNGLRLRPFDSRMIMKFDNTPYCQLFPKLGPGKKLELGSVRWKKLRDGYSGQWGPFNFEEVAAGDYQARIVWHSERAQCLDEGTRQMRPLPSVWRGMVRSNQVAVHLP